MFDLQDNSETTESNVAEEIFQAAKEGNINTISRLLPNSTVQDLKYEEEVLIVVLVMFIPLLIAV